MKGILLNEAGVLRLYSIVEKLDLLKSIFHFQFYSLGNI